MYSPVLAEVLRDPADPHGSVAGGDDVVRLVLCGVLQLQGLGWAAAVAGLAGGVQREAGLRVPDWRTAAAGASKMALGVRGRPPVAIPSGRSARGFRVSCAEPTLHGRLIDMMLSRPFPVVPNSVIARSA